MNETSGHGGAYPLIQWAAGWYMKKRHIVEPGTYHRALCSPYTGVYALGSDRSSRPGRPVPPANHEAVMALPACRLCLRKVRANDDERLPDLYGHEGQPDLFGGAA